MKFDGVLLDMDHTLYDYNVAHSDALSRVFRQMTEYYHIPDTTLHEAFHLSRRAIHNELHGTAASHNRLLYFQRMCEHLGLNPLEPALVAYNLYWDTFLNRMTLFEDAKLFFTALKGRRICLVTDLTAQIQFKKIRKLGIEDHLYALVTSEEAGRDKPHPYIFMLGLKKLGLGVANVCMIGDSYEKDVLGATQLGIETFWVNRGKRSAPDHELVTETDSLRNIIERLNG